MSTTVRIDGQTYEAGFRVASEVEKLRARIKDLESAQGARAIAIAEALERGDEHPTPLEVELRAIEIDEKLKAGLPSLAVMSHLDPLAMALMRRAYAYGLAAAPPAPSAPSREPMTEAVDGQLVVAAKALSVSRGLDPETLHQVHDDPYDHMDAQGRKFVFGWRKQMPHVQAVVAALHSALSQEKG